MLYCVGVKIVLSFLRKSADKFLNKIPWPSKLNTTVDRKGGIINTASRLTLFNNIKSVMGLVWHVACRKTKNICFKMVMENLFVKYV